MNFLKAILILFFIHGLLGCATTSTRPCVSSLNKERSTDYRKSTIKQNITGNVITENKIPLSEFSGIQSAQIIDSSLKIKFINREYIESFSTPQVDIIENTDYEPHPTRALVGATFLIPNLLIDPDYSLDFTLGCHEESYLRNVPDLEKKKSIGYTWKDTKIQKYHKIVITGFDKDYEFTITNDEIIDLRNAIFNSDLTQNTILKISCIDCKEQNNIAQSTFDYAKNTITLTENFKKLKQKLLITEGPRIKKEKELAEKNAELEKIKLKALKIKQDGVPLDEFENKCIALDFKKGTKDFGDCVLKLNEIK